MSSKKFTSKLFDDIEGLPVTADKCADPVRSNGGLAIPVAIEKVLGFSGDWLICGSILGLHRKSSISLFDILLFRILAIVASYEDFNNLDSLREDNILKATLRRLPSSL